ncbi:MAG: alpha/beta hydrolase [Actinomycetia bacterium]|nr:alpha/beta hydrolase [Actinomycetes bacterium]
MTTAHHGLSLGHYPGRREGVGAVVVPAFLDSKASPWVVAQATALAADGIPAWTFDPRGTWSSTGTAADLGPSVQVADLLTLVATLPYEHVVLVGHCYGGHLALLAAVHDERIRAVAAIAPTRCFLWDRPYAAAMDTWPTVKGRPFLRKEANELREFWVPSSVVDDACRFDLVDTLRRLDRDVLFVAGDRDTVVDAGSVQTLHHACASPSSTFVQLPVGHDYRDSPAELRLVSDTVTKWVSGLFPG